MTRLALAFCGLMFLGACNSSKKTAESEYREPGSTSQRGGGDRKGPPDAAQAIAQMDANSDGKLSIDEVKGRLKDDFTKVDSNGDGFVTKAELESAKPKGGGGRPQRN